MFLSKFFYELTQTDVLSRIGKPQVTNSSTSIGPHWVKSNINSASFKFKFQSSRQALLSSCTSSKTVTILRGIWTITPPSRISSRPKKMAEQNKSFLSFFGPLVQDCDDPRWWIKMHPGGPIGPMASMAAAAFVAPFNFRNLWVDSFALSCQVHLCIFDPLQIRIIKIQRRAKKRLKICKILFHISASLHSATLWLCNLQPQF